MKYAELEYIYINWQWQFVEPVVEHVLIVCIASLKSGPLLFKGLLAAIDLHWYV